MLFAGAGVTRERPRLDRRPRGVHRQMGARPCSGLLPEGHAFDLRGVPRRARAPRLGEPDESLAVALGPGQAGGEEAENRGGSRGAVDPLGVEVGRSIPTGAEVGRSIPAAASPTATSAARRSAGSRTTPPLPTRSRPTSNWGLTSASTSWGSPRQRSTAGSTLVREMKETSTTARSATEPPAKHRGSEGTRIGALQHPHPRVGAQAVVELSITHVHRDHRGGAALQQAVCEPPRRGPHVERRASRHGDIGTPQRVLQLDPPTRDEPRALVHAESHVRRDHLPRLLGALATRADPHLARHHGGRGAAARREQAALGEKGVQTLLGHARNGIRFRFATASHGTSALKRNGPLGEAGRF